MEASLLGKRPRASTGITQMTFNLQSCAASGHPVLQQRLAVKTVAAETSCNERGYNHRSPNEPLPNLHGGGQEAKCDRELVIAVAIQSNRQTRSRFPQRLTACSDRDLEWAQPARRRTGQFRELTSRMSLIKSLRSLDGPRAQMSKGDPPQQTFGP